MPPRWSSTDLTLRAALAGIAVALPAIAFAQSPLPVTRNTLVPFDVSPFPFNGISPRTGKPFLDVDRGRAARTHGAQRRALGGRRPTATAGC